MTSIQIIQTLFFVGICIVGAVGLLVIFITLWKTRTQSQPPLPSLLPNWSTLQEAEDKIKALLSALEPKQIISDFDNLARENIQKLYAANIDDYFLSKILWTVFYQPFIKGIRDRAECDKVCGIYRWFTSDNRSYIGQSTDIGRRIQEHVKDSLTAHPQGYFHKQLKEIGIENFNFQVLHRCSKDKLNELEAYYIDKFEASTKGYNTLNPNK